MHASTDGLPKHISDAVFAVEQLHERHERGARPVQRIVERATRAIARPGTVIMMLAFISLWLIVNATISVSYALDPPPFQGLQVALGIISVILTCVILSTQQRADILASNRAHLTLQLAILAEQKNAKTIALLEELRRDLPLIKNRPDDLADQLSQPADTVLVMEQLTPSASNLDSCD